MTTRHMKRCTMSLFIREMQIKTTMRYHLTPVRVVVINKSTNNMSAMIWSKGNAHTLLVRMWRKGNPSALLVGMPIGAATVESSMEISEKIKNGSTF